MRRLRAEEIRDSILAVNGTLNLDRMYGPSMYPVIPKEVLAGQSVPGQNWGNSPREERNRRSVYIHIKRSLQVPLLASHDQEDTDSPCPVRYTTTVPTQALGMLNGDFANEQAAALADRLAKERPGDLPAQSADQVWPGPVGQVVEPVHVPPRVQVRVLVGGQQEGDHGQVHVGGRVAGEFVEKGIEHLQ